MTYDGSKTENGYAFYMNGTRMPIERGAYGGQDSTITPELKGAITNTAAVTIGASRNNDKGIEGSIAEFRIFDRVISEEEARLAAVWPLVAASAAKDAAQLTVSERDALKLLYLAQHDAGYQELTEAITRASNEHREIELRSNTAMVLEERTDSKPAARLLFRGMYDQPRELLDAATPSFLPAMAPKLPRNRLGLARWIVDPANPLFARVIVNRLWQEFFGAGIVESADDFGLQGRPPSHPELIDWLAVEFRESGWDVKRLITLMVTSSAYRQSAVASPEKLSKDPSNTLLARGPRFRLDGEVLRDAALAASGLLVTKMGGPPVKPLPASGHLGSDVDGCEQHKELQTGHRRVAVSPQSVHALETTGSAGVNGYLRRPDARNLRRPPRPDEHPDAGAGDDERSAVRRSGTGAGGGRDAGVEGGCQSCHRFHDRSRAGARLGQFRTPDGPASIKTS